MKNQLIKIAKNINDSIGKAEYKVLNSIKLASVFHQSGIDNEYLIKVIQNSLSKYKIFKRRIDLKISAAILLAEIKKHDDATDIIDEIEVKNDLSKDFVKGISIMHDHSRFPATMNLMDIYYRKILSHKYCVPYAWSVYYKILATFLTTYKKPEAIPDGMLLMFFFRGGVSYKLTSTVIYIMTLFNEMNRRDLIPTFQSFLEGNSAEGINYLIQGYIFAKDQKFQESYDTVTQIFKLHDPTFGSMRDDVLDSVCLHLLIAKEFSGNGFQKEAVNITNQSYSVLTTFYEKITDTRHFQSAIDLMFGDSVVFIISEFLKNGLSMSRISKIYPFPSDKLFENLYYFHFIAIFNRSGNKSIADSLLKKAIKKALNSRTTKEKEYKLNDLISCCFREGYYSEAIQMLIEFEKTLPTNKSIIKQFEHHHGFIENLFVKLISKIGNVQAQRFITQIQNDKIKDIGFIHLAKDCLSRSDLDTAFQKLASLTKIPIGTGIIQLLDQFMRCINTEDEMDEFVSKLRHYFPNESVMWLKGIQ
jgi:tetratricopeptide (TPR) repeat protein